MTKSNREVKSEMGGNVLDMQMAKGKPAVIESRTYEPGEYPDPDAPRSEPGLFDPAFVPGRHEHPATDRLTIGGFTAPSVDGVPLAGACSSCGATIGAWDRCVLTMTGGRYERQCGKCSPHVDDHTYSNAPASSWSTKPAAEIMADLERVAKEIAALPPTTWNGVPFPSEPVTFCNRATEPLTMQGVRDAADRLLRGEPAREQVKTHARLALRTGSGWAAHDPQRAMVSIAREQNSGLRDAYVVRLNGAPQFTTYDAEEALDIFADMVTGERTPKSTARNPDPSPGQVWLPPAGCLPQASTASDGTVTVTEKRAPTGYVFVGSADVSRLAWPVVEMTDPARGWRCVGVETPHGRVMVGDEFVTDNGWAFTIAGIVDGDHLVRRFPDGSEDRHTRACYLLDHGSTARRTRYAPAREGERYRWRASGDVATVAASARGHDAALWERLDPGRAERAPTVRKTGAGYVAGVGGVKAGEMVALAPPPVVKRGYVTAEEWNRWIGEGAIASALEAADAVLDDALRNLSGHGGCVLPAGARLTMEPPSRTLATPGGIPAAAPEPTEEQRVAAAIFDRRCLDLGCPRREGEDDDALTARLDAAEVDRLLTRAIAKGRPWLVGVAYAREGHTVTLPDARAFLAALDALAAERDVDAAVETFRRARMATGPTWLRPALERAARELTGSPAVVVAVAPRVQRTRWEDPCAWAEAVNYWERGTR